MQLIADAGAMPDELTSPAEVAEILPDLAAWAWSREPSPDPSLELELERVFGKAFGRFGVRRPAGTRAERFPARLQPWDGALPKLEAPVGGWVSSTPADTARLASVALTASSRATAAHATASDPASRARAAGAARTEAETLQAYVAQATEHIAASSRPWLARIGEHARSLPTPAPAIPPATDRRPIAGYTETPITL